MKTRRCIYYTLTIIFILFNLIAWINLDWSNVPEDPYERIGYYLGSCIFLIVGLVFLLLARSVNKKIKRKRERELLESLPN